MMSISRMINFFKKITEILIFMSAIFYGGVPNKLKAQNLSIGELPNKLQFFIRETSPNNSETLFYFIIKTGSINETDEELGYAHFLEHMAFRGGKRFTKKTFTAFLKEQGLQLGKHYNAVTNYDYTLYTIRFPNKASIKVQKQIYYFFADILDGLHLNEKDIVIEKKIVLAEKESREETDKHFKFKLGTSLYQERSPIGTYKSITSITPKKLASFYTRLYSSQRSGIFVAGPINTKETEKLIKEIFKENKKKGREKEQKYGLYNKLKDEVLTVTNTKTKDKKIYLHFGLKHESKRLKEKSNIHFFKKILSNRLKKILKEKISSLSISEAYFLSDVNYWTISCSTKGNLHTIINIILLEIKRLAEKGISKKEAKHYKGDEELIVKDELYTLQNLKAMFLEEERVLVEKDIDLKEISNSKLKKLANRLYKEAKKRIFITCPVAMSTPFSTSSFKKLLKEVHSEKLLPYIFSIPQKKKEEQLKSKVKFNIQQLEINKPIQEKYYNNLDITVLKYSSGLTLFLKPIKDRTKELRIVGIAEGGTSFLPDSLYASYEATVSYMELGGVGNLSYSALQKYLEDKKMGLSFNITEYQRMVLGYTEEKNIEEFFKYLYLKLTSARKNKEVFEQLIKEELIKLKNTFVDKDITKGRAADFKKAELTNMYFPRRKVAMTIQDYNRLNLSEMHLFYRRLFSYGNDWKILIIGNFEIASIKPILHKYLGNLKRGRRRVENTPLFYREDFENNFQYKKENFKKTVATTLFFYNQYAPNLKNNLLIAIFEKMLQEKVADLLREKYGIAYAPKVMVEKHTYNQPFFVVNINYSCKKEDVKKAKKLVVNFLEAMKRKHIKIRNFKTYKKQVLLQYQAVFNSKNSYQWEAVLQKSITAKEKMDALNNFSKILGNLSLEDLYKNIQVNFNIGSLKTIEIIPN
ncbi:Protein of unknown function. Putative peptidase [Tenacibaculum maritimum NCIMB 2154]|uniref:Insulinase family protein n=2 Tax=Tenacibaculum maritimum TaxID=107401 RepID=A0A2H1EBG6_9FLAO|nr:Protein of unknown function. Putative peptidase [Tenacibaculum maritimum NCIMB 2154]